MKPVTKYTDNTGAGESDNASYVTATTDYLFLLAEFEYHGARAYANSAEKNYQKQYDYYKAGNSKVHNRFENPESAVSAWTRSAHAGYGDNFCLALRHKRGCLKGAVPRLCRLIAAGRRTLADVANFMQSQRSYYSNFDDHGRLLRLERLAYGIFGGALCSKSSKPAAGKASA